MPELPEVETLRRGLLPFVEGTTITGVTLRRADLRFPFPRDFAETLAGRHIHSLSRRAKYLLFHMDEELILASHLGMSGSYRIHKGVDGTEPGTFNFRRPESETHDHVVFRLQTPQGEQAELIYNDPRRFGFMLLMNARELSSHPAFATLGIEPTGNRFDGVLLAELLEGRRMPLKAALMDQRLIVGLGNIYACEALWRSSLDPRQPAGSIAGNTAAAKEAADRLARMIRTVIDEALDAGGSSLRDFVHADGSPGYFQHRFNVYDREGERCPRSGCGGTIDRIVQAGRSTYYCPRCQK